MSLALRPMTAEDLPDKVRWSNDPQVNAWIAMLEPVDLEGTRRWYAAQQRDPDISLFTITFEARGIGFVKLGRYPNAREGELLGIVIGEPDLWGRGLGKLAVTEAIRIAFAVEGWDRFWVRCPAWNRRSFGLYQRLGFVFQGADEVQRPYLDGTLHDMLALAMERSTWREFRAPPRNPRDRSPSAG